MKCGVTYTETSTLYFMCTESVFCQCPVRVVFCTREKPGTHKRTIGSWMRTHHTDLCDTRRNHDISPQYSYTTIVMTHSVRGCLGHRYFQFYTVQTSDADMEDANLNTQQPPMSQQKFMETTIRTSKETADSNQNLEDPIRRGGTASLPRAG